MDSVVAIAPSLICCDLCNIERELKVLQEIGTERLHVDLVDGRFSPSMPIGIETVRQARAITGLPFDVHLMARDNEFFVHELADVGVDSMCFHIEAAFHVDRLLTLIEQSGAKAGVALMPMTPLSTIEYCVERVSFILLTLINPGYAGQPREEQVPYAEKKVADCRRYLSRRGIQIPIHVDGRISFENIPNLVAAGADVLVAGSRSLFHPSAASSENLVRMQQAISLGLRMRSARSLP